VLLIRDRDLDQMNAMHTRSAAAAAD
jgi:hypothetical protein